MKVKFVLYFICLAGLMFSCEQEDITSTPESIDSTVVPIDSSQLSHNLFWNGRYYLLEFDTAFAWYSSWHFYKNTVGGGPAPLVFQCNYIDKYREEKFNLYMVLYIGMSNVSTNYCFYDASEARQRLQTYGEALIDDLDWNYFGTGIILRHNNVYGVNVFPEYDNAHNYLDVMEVVSYETHVNTEVTADFHIKVTRPQFYLDLNGMFRAQ